MAERLLSPDDIKSYFAYSKEIAELESTIYEPGRELTLEESKITDVVAAQNKIRFEEDEKDIFRDQLENVIRTLASNYKEFGFDGNLYFDLVYNLLFLEYDRFEKLTSEDRINEMLCEIGIDDYLKGRVKSLLDSEKEGGCGGGCHEN